MLGKSLELLTILWGLIALDLPVGGVLGFTAVSGIFISISGLPSY
jgi:hypothetical protein